VCVCVCVCVRVCVCSGSTAVGRMCCWRGTLWPELRCPAAGRRGASTKSVAEPPLPASCRAQAEKGETGLQGDTAPHHPPAPAPSPSPDPAPAPVPRSPQTRRGPGPRTCIASGADQKNSGVSSTELSRLTADRCRKTWGGSGFREAGRPGGVADSGRRAASENWRRSPAAATGAPGPGLRRRRSRPVAAHGLPAQS
jgi:hypothetical protein